MRIAYLTIDDSPSKDFKKKVDYLLKKNIPAIFFCRGDLIEKREKEIIYAIKKGFIIGNHSYNHPHFSQLSFEDETEQIKKTDKIINNIYKKAGLKSKKIFRFPYGDKGNNKTIKKLQQVLKNLIYRQPEWHGITYKWFKDRKLDKNYDCYWTCDIKEWCLKGNYNEDIKTFNDVLKRINKTRNSNSNEIILMHDHEQTTKYFFKIIDELIKKDFKFCLPDIK
jgi:peptidoglycan-N-acetylglucosamine deacetylase